ncbi:MAG: geranylgeranylglycerol-phosphate geranylgeranyltransferase [Bacteroidota bacterium]
MEATGPVPSLRARLGGLLQLARPLNVVMFFAGVALGGLLASGLEAFAGQNTTRISLAMVSAALIGAAANAINDLFDLEIDRVNRPGRPLPSGLVPLRAARALWATASALGVGLSAFLSWAHLGIAAASVGLLWGYSRWLKRTPLVGNLAIALVLGLAIFYGGLAVAPFGETFGWRAALLGAAFAFGSTLAREIAKDIEDAAGDEAGGARTLPLVIGGEASTWVAAVAVGGTLALFPLALTVGLGADFFLLALPAAGLLLAAAWYLLSAPPARRTRHAGAASSLLKLAMVAGILALAGARLIG